MSNSMACEQFVVLINKIKSVWWSCSRKPKIQGLWLRLCSNLHLSFEILKFEFSMKSTCLIRRFFGRWKNFAILCHLDEWIKVMSMHVRTHKQNSFLVWGSAVQRYRPQKNKHSPSLTWRSASLPCPNSMIFHSLKELTVLKQV